MNLSSMMFSHAWMIFSKWQHPRILSVVRVDQIHGFFLSFSGLRHSPMQYQKKKEIYFEHTHLSGCVCVCSPVLTCWHSSSWNANVIRCIVTDHLSCVQAWRERGKMPTPGGQKRIVSSSTLHVSSERAFPRRQERLISKRFLSASPVEKRGEKNNNNNNTFRSRCLTMTDRA